MEPGDILIVRDDKSTLKLCNINSNLFFTIQNELSKKEKDWTSLSKNVSHLKNVSHSKNTSYAKKIGGNDCFLSHEEQGGNIPISSIIQMLKPEVFAQLNHQNDNDDIALNNSLPVEQDIPDVEFENQYLSLNKSDIGGKEEISNMNTEKVNRIINCTHF